MKRVVAPKGLPWSDPMSNPAQDIRDAFKQYQSLHFKGTVSPKFFPQLKKSVFRHSDRVYQLTLGIPEEEINGRHSTTSVVWNWEEHQFECNDCGMIMEEGPAGGKFHQNFEDAVACYRRRK